MTTSFKLVGNGMEAHADDDRPLISTPAPHPWTKRLGAAVCSAAVLLGVVGVATWSTHLAPHQAISRVVGETSEKIEVSPVGKQCSKVSEDCSQTKCCQVTGYKCFHVNESYAGCTKAPKAGQTREGLVPWAASKPPPGTSMFCFTAYVEDTGSTRKNYELELLQIQYGYNTGIFACDSQMVFSDIELTSFPGITTVKVDAPQIAKRKSTGTWINAPFFANGWEAIGKDGRWADYDWTIKIDPDAVFLPDRLKLKLSGQEVTEKGVYFTNCEHVKFGFFGNLEVVSKAAFSNLLDGLDECRADPKVNNKTFGEDLFMQMCMEKMGVSNVEDFYVTTDDACDAIARVAKTPGVEKKVTLPNCKMGTPAFHPLKMPSDYIECLAMAAAYPR
jgi:hypothetical protein